MDLLAISIAIATAFSIAADTLVRDLELTAITALAIAMYLALHGLWQYLAIAIVAIFVKPAIRIIMLEGRTRLTRLYAAFRSLTYTILYITSGVAFGYISLFVSIPYLDLWTARVLFVLVIFLALSLTASPTLDTLSYLADMLARDIETLCRGLYFIAMAVGVPIAFYSISVVKYYITVPILAMALTLVFSRRYARYRKRMVVLSFFITLLITILCVG